MKKYRIARGKTAINTGGVSIAMTSMAATVRKEVNRAIRRFIFRMVSHMSMSREKRFSIRPMGLVSKKDIGARSSL